ncbi:hypothetical protein BJV77DRAFT_1071623 [Russula vinacea]|nr:hypothetical protein BJV77DRAFT_1071623 [Russula vinacea]
MENFHDPAIMVSAQDQLTLVKFWHATGGLYIWDFVTTLNYEWRVIRGDLPYRWTIWIYSVARVSALVGLILCLSSMDVATQINCQPWILFAFVDVFLPVCDRRFAIDCSSHVCLHLQSHFAAIFSNQALIDAASIAIWNRNKVVVALTIMVWGMSIGFHLQNVVRLRYAWDPTEHACEPVKADYSVLGLIPTMIADIALFLIILAGLFALRSRGGGTLAHLLWKQGVIWLALGAIAEVPPLVFTVLHMNDQLHSMFETPAVIIMTIAATRMHRSLVNFASVSSDVAHDNPQLSSLVFSKTKRTDTAPTALDRIEVTVQTAVTAIEQHSTGHISDHDSSTIVSRGE